MAITDKVSHSAHEAYDKIADATSQAHRGAWRKRRATEKSRAEIDEELLRLYQRQPHNVGGYRSGGWLSAESPVEPTLDRLSNIMNPNAATNLRIK